jgi:hypothetical protein
MLATGFLDPVMDAERSKFRLQKLDDCRPFYSKPAHG